MSTATFRTFQEVYVDRDLSKWTGPSVARKVALVTNDYAPGDPTTATDLTTGQPALETTFPSGIWQSLSRPSAEALYTSPVDIGSVYYAWKRNAIVNPADPFWFWLVYAADDDTLTSFDNTANLSAAGPGTGTLTADAGRRFASVRHYYDDGPAGNEGDVYSIFWTVLAVYGAHGLTKRGTASATTAQGFYASDVIRDIVDRFCPLLDSSQIEDTSYVVGQIAFTDPITPFDAISQLNDLHQYELGVWEDRKLAFAQPSVLDDWDWEIRRDDPGVSFNFQGDSIEDLANGIVVRYTDLIKGAEQVLTPETHPELADTSELNPANQRGIDRWTEVQVPYSTLELDAVQLGRAALGEFSRPKAPGEFQVGGHIRDRAGNWQPGSRVRAGQRVVVSDHPNDAPRRITETAWDDVNKTLRITTDNASHRLEGMFARIAGSRSARGL